MRRFLDDQVWLENRRVVELLRGIEAKALALRDHGPVTLRIPMEASSPSVMLPMERPLYAAVEKAAIASSGVVGVSSPTIAQSDLDLPLVVTQLMKGVLHQDTHAKAWRHLLQLQAQVRDYVATMGLVVVVDEAEGYAFLRSRADDLAWPANRRTCDYDAWTADPSWAASPGRPNSGCGSTTSPVRPSRPT